MPEPPQAPPDGPQAPPEHVVEFGKGGTPPAEADGRLDSPAFHRNHAPIWSVLSCFLEGRHGDVLEIGSGTGQHVVVFAGHSPAITWWPSDLLDSHLRSVDAWRRHERRDNVRAPVRLDAGAADWKLPEHGLPSAFAAMLCINVVHIAPWRVTEGIFAGARRHLGPDGRLFLYGPFRRDGTHNSPGNQTFDAHLRRDNPEWGVRDTADLRKLAEVNGLQIAELVEMPSNNATLVLERIQRQSGPPGFLDRPRSA
jgi:SAM-dependent methyltransferase